MGLTAIIFHETRSYSMNFCKQLPYRFFLSPGINCGKIFNYAASMEYAVKQKLYVQIFCTDFSRKFATNYLKVQVQIYLAQ
jgi:hypothetical protein